MGDVLTFSGRATDPDEGPLAPDRLGWQLDLHHGDRILPIMAPRTGTAGDTVTLHAAGVTDPAVFFRLTLGAADAEGAADTTTRDLTPLTAELTFTTSPAGLDLVLDGTRRAAPFTTRSLAGLSRTVETPTPQLRSGIEYRFHAWADSAPATRDIRTPDTAATYHAVWVVAQNAPPTAAITQPAEGATYRAGDVITFAGTGDDREEGVLAAARFTWWADFHHDEHTHPFMDPRAGTTRDTIRIPTIGETSANVWYRFYLRVADSTGAADTVFRDVLPVTSAMTFVSLPAGLALLLDGQPRTAPFTVTGVAGIEREIGLVSPQTLADSVYEFVQWSTGPDTTQRIVTPGTDSTFTATFTATGPANRPPVVALTAPNDLDTAFVGMPVAFEATATDSGGSVTQVEFLVNDSVVATVTAAPYDTSWTPGAAGSVTVTARATDDGGASASSSPVTLVVASMAGDAVPPTVTLTAPADSARNLTAPLVLSATASDDVGVAGVRFQIDGQDVGAEDTSSPYSLTVNDLTLYTSGVHVVRARARDAAGNLSAWSTAAVEFGGARTLPAGFTRATWADGLTLATTMAFAPDGRLFVAEKSGALRVVDNGVLLAQPFLTVTTTGTGEQGLLGVTFDPDFGTNGWVYIYYTSTEGGAHNRVSRFTASGDTAASGSELVLVDLPPAEAIHNGGALHFGSDGRLYVAVGDNATSSNAPSLTTVFGKILRFNADGSIPGDNPFFGSTTGLNRAIWARGLRNPFTFAFQPGTGRMFINDVGQDTWEEINDGLAGANYGWPQSEGPTTDAGITPPIFAYRHPGAGDLVEGLAVVGAAFYNPTAVSFPASYVGSYFFADFVQGWINRLDPGNDNAVYAFARLPDFNQVTDVRVGPDGALYVLMDLMSSWGVVRFSSP